MNKRGYVRLSSFMAVALAILIAVAVINTRNMNSYKKQLEVSYQYSLAELNESLDNINTDLTKSLYSNAPEEQLRLSRDLYAQCTVAKNAVNRLPVSQMELGNTYKFLSQASDYAQYLGAKLQNGIQISEKEHQNLVSLLRYAEQFGKSAAAMMHIASQGSAITEGKVKNNATVAVTPLSNSFSQSAKAFESYPTLLYDGPFSDQVLNKNSALLAASEVYDKNECRKAAADCLHTEERKLRFDSDEKSKIPAYTYQSGRYTVSVTKQGRYIKSILSSGLVLSSNISEKNAVNLASRFLRSIGYPDMRESYYATADNICTVNFAYTKNNVTYYSDLIKVGVSLADGKIVSLDASTYLTNHTERKPFRATIKAKDAQRKLSPFLKVNSVKRCVIPKEDGTEVACYEFACTGTDTGEDALVYLNADFGVEEDIMLLLYTDNGTLVK